VKSHIESVGGQVGSDSTLLSGFHAKLPKDNVSTLDQNEHVDYVEADQEFRTQ